MKTDVFKGSATALITPMKADGSVNFSELGRLIDFQVENQTAALVLCGTTGESSTLSDQEKLSVIEYAVEKTDRRIPVIAGTGSNNTAHTIELSLRAAQLGADAVLVITPYYNKTSQDGLVAHFKTVADSVDLPIIIYNVPSRTGMTVEPETYRILAQHPNIVATKEASSNFTSITTAMELCGDDLVFYSGNDDTTVPMMALGAKGLVSVFSNVMPLACAEMCRLCLEGDFSGAASLQIRYIHLMNALFSDVSPIPVKNAMNFIGFEAGSCRLPLVDMAPNKQDQLERILFEVSGDPFFRV